MIVIAKIQVKDGQQTAFESVFKPLVEKVSQEEGTLGYQLIHSSEDSTRYIVVEEYKDQESLDFHSNTPYFKETGKALGAILSAPPEIEIFELVAAK